MGKNNKVKEQPKALQKEEEQVQEAFTFMGFNPTKKIIDTLKENYVFRHNLGNQKMEFHKIDETEFRDMSDTDFNSIRVELNLQDIPCSREPLRGIIFSDQWEQYNPYQEFLQSLPLWDGKDYISELATSVHTDNEEYWKWCFRKWFVAFLGSLADDETVNQTALILCGKQGVGKTSWLKSILHPKLRKYTSSGYLNPKDKESLIQLSELCLFNLDEVENLLPRNLESIKEFLTKSSIYLRRAYTTLSQNYIRRCSFCGTANGTNILHDTSGNRRFLCQNVLDISDYELKSFNFDQLYAQAYQLYRTDFQYWFNKDEQATVEEHNTRFRSESPEEELVNTYFEPCDAGDEGAKRMQATEIQSYLQRKVSHVHLSSVMIGRILSSKGYQNKKVNGISKWIIKERPLSDTE